MEPIRLLIADDHEPFRHGLRAMLRGETDMAVVGEAADGETALARAELLQPDVVLMDLKMPSRNGLEATRGILHTSPHVRVLVLTMADDDESVFAALQGGPAATCSRATCSAPFAALPPATPSSGQVSPSG